MPFFYPEKKPLEYQIQIPSMLDLMAMKNMPAGEGEDQQCRLSHVVQTIRKHSPFSIMDTEQAVLSPHWIAVFTAINQGEKKIAFQELSALFMAKDRVLMAILSVHPLKYVQKIVIGCLEANSNLQTQRFDDDVLITKHTFEALIKDLATTLQSKSSLLFSFGLPSHHAEAIKEGGFCIFNKTAILMQSEESVAPGRVQHVVIGHDINRDNGLMQICLRNPTVSCYHMDIFDPRVYPYQDYQFINTEFSQDKKTLKSPGIHSWQQGCYIYVSIGLDTIQRSKDNTIHPAMLWVIDELKKQLEKAKLDKKQIILYLPSGWDSHEQETAPCGKLIYEKMMSASCAKKQRFNDEDFHYFYSNIRELYLQNKPFISKIYWSLEGGYNQAMYEKQIELMLNCFSLEALSPEPLNPIRLGK